MPASITASLRAFVRWAAPRRAACRVPCAVCRAQIYLLVVTIPRWDELVAAPVNASGGNVMAISWMWLASAVALFVHFWSFYRVCSVSSVHVGISKAVESALIFVMADVLYCKANPVSTCTCTVLASTREQ